MDFKEIESFLTNIKSVISCKIIADQENNINEIHVLSDNSRNTKQIARDIRSALMTNYNKEIDYKIISIAQIDKNLAINTEFRLIYEGYTNEISSDYIKITTKFNWDENVYFGEAEGIKSEKNTLKVAASATLNAIKSATGFNCFLVEDVQPSRIGGQEIMVSAVTHLDHGKESILIGSSVVTNNIIDSTIKATLDAVNRKVCLYYKE
jgi:hypothetical protein